MPGEDLDGLRGGGQVQGQWAHESQRPTNRGTDIRAAGPSDHRSQNLMLMKSAHLPIVAFAIALLISYAVGAPLADGTTRHCKTIIEGAPPTGFVCGTSNPCPGTTTCRLHVVLYPDGSSVSTCKCDSSADPTPCCSYYWVIIPEGQEAAALGGDCNPGNSACGPYGYPCQEQQLAVPTGAPPRKQAACQPGPI